MTLQTNYNLYMEESFPGMIVDSYPNKNTISRAAQEAITFGFGVVKGDDPAKQCRLPKLENSTLVFAGDFVSLNVINLKVNGVAIAPVTFDTDHDTTAALLVIAIAALDDVSSCELDSSDATNRTFLVETLGKDIAITDIVVTLGVGQTTGTATNSTDDVFAGVARHEHKMSNFEQISEYKITEAVNVLDEGVIWVYVNEAVAVDDVAYLVAPAGSDRGKFSKTSTNNIVTGGKFKSATTGAGYAQLKIRLL
jgi:hypothetical protein